MIDKYGMTFLSILNLVKGIGLPKVYSCLLYLCGHCPLNFHRSRQIFVLLSHFFRIDSLSTLISSKIRKILISERIPMDYYVFRCVRRQLFYIFFRHMHTCVTTPFPWTLNMFVSSKHNFIKLLRSHNRQAESDITHSHSILIWMDENGKTHHHFTTNSIYSLVLFIELMNIFFSAVLRFSICQHYFLRVCWQWIDAFFEFSSFISRSLLVWSTSVTSLFRCWRNTYIDFHVKFYLKW